MSDLGVTAFAVAFAGGLVSFLSPCVLALVPGYLAFLSGVSVDRLGARPREVVGPTLAFVAAFGLVFTLLGAGLGQVSAVLLEERRTLEVVGGVLLVAFGLLVLVGPRFGLLQRERRLFAMTRRGRGRMAGAVLAGFAFAIAWTPCIGPVLGAILTFAATGQSPWGGAALLFTYSLGLGIPFLLTSLAFERVRGMLGRVRPLGPALVALGALGLVAAGALVASGRLAVITQELSRFDRFG